jgi:glycolate oxidase FAD binding subunit
MPANASSQTRISARDLEGDFAAIVGAANLRPAGVDDAIGAASPQMVVAPGTEQEIAAVLRCANEAGLAVLPRGGGTKPGWGNAPSGADLILSTTRLNKIIEHAWADLTVTVEAGCTIQTLQATLAKQGQRLALDALWPERATVGGVLATNESGALRLRFGALRDLIIGVTLALPDGTLAKSGGKVVKNVAGYDLPKLSTGALGTLGVITRAVFRLHPLPRKTRSLSVSGCNLDEAQRLILAIQASKLAHTAMQARFAAGAPPEINILLEGTEDGIAAQEAAIRKLTGQALVKEAPAAVWSARQTLWNDAAPTAIASISVLPSDIASTVRLIERTTNAGRVRWQAVVQATGIGSLRLDGASQALTAAIQQLRAELQPAGGSLVLLRRAPGMEALDAWGYSGDALPLMRAVKHQLDAKGTLNPGRFVGGI